MDYHFIAFVEKDGILYDLDGRKPAPVNCGPTCKETFLRVTKFPILFFIWLVCKQQLDIYLFREHQNASHNNVQRNNTDDKRNRF